MSAQIQVQSGNMKNDLKNALIYIKYDKLGSPILKCFSSFCLLNKIEMWHVHSPQTYVHSGRDNVMLSLHLTSVRPSEPTGPSTRPGWTHILVLGRVIRRANRPRFSLGRVTDRMTRPSHSSGVNPASGWTPTAGDSACLRFCQARRVCLASVSRRAKRQRSLTRLGLPFIVSSSTRARQTDSPSHAPHTGKNARKPSQKSKYNDFNLSNLISAIRL